MALGRLREAIGDELFVRAGSQMEPTPRASQLWAAVEPALDSIEAAVRGAKQFEPAQARMTVRFAAPDDLEFVLIPLLLGRLAERAPGVRLVVRPADFRTLMERLDTADADLALSATPPRGLERRHKVRPLHRETFSVLFDARLVGAASPLDLDTYLSVPHVLLSIAGDLHGPIDDWLSGAGRTRRVLAAVSHFPTMPFILRQQRALANIPATAAHHFAAAYGLALSPLPLPSPDFEVALIWHARTDDDPAYAWFRDLVAEIISTLTTAAKRPRGQDSVQGHRSIRRKRGLT